VVFADIRGRYESEGNWDPFRDESKDGYDVIEWAAAQPFSNGKVATQGGSYLGHNQWAAMSATPPHLVAAFPGVASTNIYANWLTMGGAFRLSFNYGWGVVRMPNRIMLPQYWHTEAYTPEELKYENILWHLPLKTGDLKGAGYAVKHYRDWINHESYDDYWKSISDEENFSNMNVYLLNQGFDVIFDEKSFPAGTAHGKWGIYDQYLFAQQEKDLRSTTQPFLSVMMTLSTHEPFDVPGQSRFKGNSEANLFRNAAAYTDSCLGAYLHSVKKEPWYPNTLFIIVADHGHRLPKYRSELQPETRHIPLLFYGEVIKPEFRGMRIATWGSHHDIAKTLLTQLKMPAEKYSWSKNLLSPGVRNFAYYQIESVVGWIEDRNYVVYLYPDEGLLIDSAGTKARSDELLLHGQAFVQKLYTEYLAY